MSDKLKIQKLGDGAGVVLTKEMLAKLGAKIGDDVDVIETEAGFELKIAGGDLRDAMKWIEKGAKRYDNTLRALAK